MRKVYPLLCLLLISCNVDVKPADLDQLNGYWCIDKAVSPSGEEKQYNSTIDVDFFELKDQKGLEKN